MNCAEAICAVNAVANVAHNKRNVLFMFLLVEVVVSSDGSSLRSVFHQNHALQFAGD